MHHPVSIVSIPSALPLAEQVSPGCFLYNRSDDHGSFPHAGEAIRALEARLLEQSARVAYAARRLMEREVDIVGARALYLEHGVDAGLFRPDASPDPELMRLPAPRIGFIGGLRSHAVDFELIAELADDMPRASIVLMGDRTDRADELISRPNVHLLPPRPHASTPSCWAALDVALMPYRYTPWTWAIEPIKLREMLAMGLPIASTSIPAVEDFRGRIDIAADRASFTRGVRSALARGRQPAPVLPDWRTQADRLAAALDDAR
jgi:glycosyltransferase involved in cell wall biosynthesis